MTAYTPMNHNIKTIDIDIDIDLGSSKILESSYKVNVIRFNHPWL